MSCFGSKCDMNYFDISTFSCSNLPSEICYDDPHFCTWFAIAFLPVRLSCLVFKSVCNLWKRICVLLLSCGLLLVLRWSWARKASEVQNLFKNFSVIFFFLTSKVTPVGFKNPQIQVKPFLLNLFLFFSFLKCANIDKIFVHFLKEKYSFYPLDPEKIDLEIQRI